MTYAAIGHADLLTELGCDVTILAANRPLAEPLEKHDHAKWQAVGSGIKGSGLPWNPIRGDVAALINYTREQSIDLVLIEGWYTPAACLTRSFSEIGCKVVLASHGAAAIIPEEYRLSEIGRAIALIFWEDVVIPRYARHLDAALVLSRYIGNERFADLNTYRKLHVETHLVPNYSFFETLGRPKERKLRRTLLNIGEMRPEKGQIAGVEILAGLPEIYDLLFAFPSENDYFHQVMQRASELGVLHRVQCVTGCHRHELKEFYDASSLLLILSPLRETQPIVAIDGLARGVPFVSTPVGCMPEMNGGLVRPYSQFADAIESICASDVAYRKFSCDALEYTANHVGKNRALSSINAMLGKISC